MRTRPGAPLDETEPPFLQEDTVRVDREPQRPLVDQLIELSYRWRVALIGGLALTVLAAMVLGTTGGNNADPLAEDERSTSSASTATTATSSSTSTADAAVPALPRPAESTTTTPASTTTTAIATTTAVPTSTTTTSTTEPPPPPTVVNCLISVRRTDLRDEPDGERIARVDRGTYAGFERSSDGDWYLIDFQGTVGWVRDRSVRDVEGDCG